MPIKITDILVIVIVVALFARENWSMDVGDSVQANILGFLLGQIVGTLQLWRMLLSVRIMLFVRCWFVRGTFNTPAMVDLNCWLSSNVWLSRIGLDIRRECREVCCEADEWPGFKTSGGQCTSILFFIFVLVFVCLYFSVVFVLASVFIFGWVADRKRLEYGSWNLTWTAKERGWDGMGFSVRMEVRWQDFKPICSTLRRRNREKVPLQKQDLVSTMQKTCLTNHSSFLI